MPNQYTRGYGGERYGGGYGGSGVTAYRGPTAIQSQSFFNPIPIDTFTGELDRRQQAFDLAYTGALANKDELAQTQVGMADLQNKERIIQSGMQDIDTLVQDQYGGDWGRAAKAVAGQVTAIRANPFWNAQKEAEKRRDEARALKMKYGADSVIFNDPTNLGVLDEQGNVRDASAFNPDIVQRGDYNKSAREIMMMVEADAQSFGLQPSDVEGLSHFLQTGDRTGISEDKIRALASNPAVQQLFLGRHGEIQRMGELSPEQQQQHGFAGKTPEQFAEEQLLGAGLTRVHSKTDLKYLQDSVAAKAKIAAGQKASTQIYGRDLTNTGETHEIGAQKRQERMFNRFERKDVSGRATGNLMTPEQWKLHRGYQEDDYGVMTTTTGEPKFGGSRVNMEKQEQQYNDIYDLVQNLRKNNPTYGESNDRELLEAYYADMDKFKLTFDKLQPIINQDVTDGLSEHLSGHIQSGVEYMIEGDAAGVINVTGKRGVTDKFNLSPQGLREYLKEEDVEFGYNYDKGMFYTEVPVFNTMQEIYDPEAGTSGFKKLYFAPDDDTKLLSKGIRTLEDSLVKGETYNNRVPMGRNQSGNDLVMEMSYGGGEAEGERPFDENPMRDSNIEVVVYEIDPYGNQTVAMMPDGVTPRKTTRNLDQIKRMVATYQEATLRNYVKTDFD